MVLGLEPLDAGTVGRANGLRVGPAAQGAALIEGEEWRSLTGPVGVSTEGGTSMAASTPCISASTTADMVAEQRDDARAMYLVRARV